jgi:hypothetical protein
MNVRLASAYGWQSSWLELNANAMEHRAAAQLRRCKSIRADKQMVLQRAGRNGKNRDRLLGGE